MQVNTVLVIIITQVALTVATAGFAKDESEDRIEFPPTILRTFDSGIPVGHLRPLGQSALMLSCFVNLSSLNVHFYFCQPARRY